MNSEDEIVKGLLIHGIDILDFCTTDDATANTYNSTVLSECLPYTTINTTINNDWLIPDSYKQLDIEHFILSQCETTIETDRVIHELTLYKQHNMYDLLRAMKYIVDTLRQNNVVWGVGRGSSVASYVLFLLGVHKINSIKYDLPIDEFFKGEN